jgi:hypothetical protein
MGMGGSLALQMLVQETKTEQAHLRRSKVVLEKEIAHQKGMHSSFILHIFLHRWSSITGQIAQEKTLKKNSEKL